MMSSNGPLIEPEVLRKKVSGMVSGLRPASFTWLAKLVICATTRQGAVTGDTRSRVAGSTVSLLPGAASICSRSASSSPVVVASVSMRAAPPGVRDPPGVGGAQDGDAHELATFRRPRRRVRSNSLSSRSARAMDTSSRSGLGPGVRPRKSLVTGGPHWASPEAVIGDQPGSRVQSNRSPSAKCSTRRPSGSRQ